MSVFVKVDEDGMVIQIQPNDEEGFIKAPDSVVCGMLLIEGEFVPPPPVTSVAPYRLFKSVFIRRMTNEDAEVMEQVLAGAAAQLRLLFNSVEYFVSDDEMFNTLTAAVGQVIGQDRASELLAADKGQIT